MNESKKINIGLLKKFIEDSHKNCNFCNLKGTICVGKNCAEEIFKSLLVKNKKEYEHEELYKWRLHRIAVKIARLRALQLYAAALDHKDVYYAIQSRLEHDLSAFLRLDREHLREHAPAAGELPEFYTEVLELIGSHKAEEASTPVPKGCPLPAPDARGTGVHWYRGDLK